MKSKETRGQRSNRGIDDGTGREEGVCGRLKGRERERGEGDKRDERVNVVGRLVERVRVWLESIIVVCETEGRKQVIATLVF